MEEAVRKVAAARNLNLVVYTGTHGSLELLANDNTPKKIYLAFDAKNKGMIPAPLYYWKVVYHKSSNTATAIIGLNNVWLTKDEIKNYAFCADNFCDGISWVNEIKTRKDVDKGYVVNFKTTTIFKFLNN